MTIDFHCHIGHSYDGSRQTIKQLKSKMRKLGIKKAVIFPIDDRNQSREEMSFKLLAAAKKDKTLIPFFRFDPKKMKPKGLRETLNSGFYGVKMHPRAENFDPLNRRFFPLYKEIAKSGKPLLMHTKTYNLKTTDPARIVTLAKRFPKLKLVLAHFGYSHPGAIRYVQQKKLRNVWFDTSVTPTQYYIISTGKKIGFDRIIFGSDSPYSDQEIELLKIKKLNISSNDKKKILGINARNLLMT